MNNYNDNNILIRRKILYALMDNIINKKYNFNAIPNKIVEKNIFNDDVYKDRAVIKYKIMALMGIHPDEEIDESITLNEYYADNNKTTEPIIGVIDIACSSCPGNIVKVTEVCRGCKAEKCKTVCPVNAVSIVNGKSMIDEEKCVKCGKCIVACPYNAIVKIEAPCVKVCPVGALYRDDGAMKIDMGKCIACGKCINACPFGAVVKVSNILTFLEDLEKGNCAALIAPSAAGHFPGEQEQLNDALRMVGFKKVYDVAVGANITAEKESAEVMEVIEKNAYLTSSCCPSYRMLVEKHITSLKGNVSSTQTPMHYTARQLKEDYPDYKTVFIGPCIAKEFEAAKDPFVDYVLTYEEIGVLLWLKNIEIDDLENISFDNRSDVPEGTRFAISGGVASMISLSNENIVTDVIDGINRKSVARLKVYEKIKKDTTFLEVMACEGGCAGGSCGLSHVNDAQRIVKEITQKEKITA